MNNRTLSDGEWKIMNALWEKQPQTIMELTGNLQEETGWDKHTIITMLNRMEKKGAISHEKKERAKQFYPLISHSEASLQETRGFLKRVYHGSIGMMVNAMVSDQSLSEQDIQELYDILERAEQEKKD